MLGSEVVVGIVEEIGDELIGFCRVLSDRGFRAWIHGVLVREDFRGKGFGRRIMEYLLGCPEFALIHNVCLSCAPEKNAFYSKWGFQVVENETIMKAATRR